MNEDRFDELMRDAAHTYRTPPEAPLEEMWATIERADGPRVPLSAARSALSARRFPRWLAIAATLVLGIGLGRVSTSLNKSVTPPHTGSPVLRAAIARADSVPVNNLYGVETSAYLGQTAALLVALPSEVESGRTNEQFVGRASDLLTTTRLLIDSPAANDPALRNLLEDLELVLAQVVRLQNNHSRTELDLINRALEQRDVIPRLRTAVADISAN